MAQKHPPLKARPEPVAQDEIRDEIAHLEKQMAENYSLADAIRDRIAELKGKLKEQG
jgi:uncharacterized coiled-coil DUF342 family protein